MEPGHERRRVETTQTSYDGLLIEGHTYQFPDGGDGPDDRPVRVAAGRCAWGGLWLLYEVTVTGLKLKFWVMPDGGIAHAVPGAAVIHQAGAATLAAQPPVAYAGELEDVTDGLDPYLRRQINDLLDRLGFGG